VTVEARVAECLGLKPLGAVRGWRSRGSNPTRWASVRLYAVPKLLARHGLTTSPVEA